MSDYRVQLDVFTGPLDLLLYLINRDEVDILDISIARLTDQYLEHVRALQELNPLHQLDPDAVSEFLVMAATLVELKSRTLLPTPPIESLDDTEDPRAPLVRQLLEYKRFKDAAKALGSAADERAKKYARVPVDLPPDLAGLELEEVQVWDLLAAFDKVMTAIGRGPRQHEVRYDEMPIELHVAEILAILEREGPTTFHELLAGDFDGRPGARRIGGNKDDRNSGDRNADGGPNEADAGRRDKSPDRLHVVGRFLALLELIRAHRVRAEQEKIFGTIYIFLLVEVPEEEGSEGPGGQGAEGEEDGAPSASEGSPTDIDAVGSPTDIGAAGSPTDIDAAALPDNAVGAVRLPDAANDSAGLPDATDDFAPEAASELAPAAREIASDVAPDLAPPVGLTAQPDSSETSHEKAE